MIGDSKEYVAWASRIAAGDWLGTDAFYQAPLYPYALGVLFRAVGVSIDAARIAQAACSSLACVLVAVAGARFFGRKTGLVAGALLALYPPSIFFDGHIQKSSL